MLITVHPRSFAIEPVAGGEGMYFPPNFDLARSVELARLVMQAYDQLDAFQKGVPWIPKGGYAAVKELAHEPAVGSPREIQSQFDTEMKLLRKSKHRKDLPDPIGFIAQNRGSIYVVFRGTVTVIEWVRNLNVRLSRYLTADFGKVHEGFLETYRVVRQTLLEVLSDLDERKSLYVVGHSLGAALATLALPDIAAHTRFKSMAIYTFGSPRVGDSQFSKSFDRMFARRSFRMVNTSDMIASLPLPVPILGIVGGYFSHIETPVDFNIQENDSEKNHRIETYLSALMAAQEQNRMWRKVLRWRFARC